MKIYMYICVSVYCMLQALINVVCTQVREHFLPPLLDAILGDYRRNVPEAREPEVLSTVSTIVDKLEVQGEGVCVCVWGGVLAEGSGAFYCCTVEPH